MNLRVLIVEDDPIQLDSLESTLSNLNESQKQRLQIDNVIIHKVAHASAAFQHLNQAVSDGRPYDVLLLDLALPENSGGQEKPEHGLQILETARKHNVVRTVIVISAFIELDRYVAPAFRLGADDFIGKKYKLEEIVLRITNVWQRYRSRKRQRLLNEARLALTTPFWKTMAYRFNIQSARFLHGFSIELEGLQEELWRSFGVTAEHKDSVLSQRLCALTSFISEAQRNWQQEQPAFDGEVETDTEKLVFLNTELRALAEDLRPCINLRIYDSSESLPHALSLGNDVRTIMRELLVSGLLDTNDSEQEWQAHVCLSYGNGVVCVSLGDDFPTIPLEQVTTINAGQPFTPRNGQWRAWGLSLLRHLAFCSGGKLEVIPPDMKDQTGNDFNYFIPLG